MVRIIAVAVLAGALAAANSGCCCCRIPFGMARFAPVVVNPPPIVVNPPPIVVDPQPPGEFPQPPIVNQPKAYVYSQGTGKLMLDNQVIGTGYSGVGPARNNAAQQNQRGTGPIPAGNYLIVRRENDAGTGEPIVHLMPEAATNTFGRWPGETLTIHADSNPPGNAGGGGIVMPRNVRDTMEVGNLKRLQVVP